MEIALIVALDEKNGIGKNNDLLCHLPNDLKRFKSLTLNHNIVMGRKTFESLPFGALPKRKNIVLTSNKAYKAKDIVLANSPDEIMEICKNQDKIFIIGGASIYKMFIDKATHLYITRIHHTFDADTFFPDFDESKWQITGKVRNTADDKNKFDYSFIDYRKIPV